MSKQLANIPTVALPKFRLPEPIYDHYSERAAKFGRTIEDELALRLRDTQQYSAASPIYLDDAARAEMTSLAGYMIRTPEDLLKWARKQVEIKVGGVEISLSTQLADRLRSRCFGATWQEHVTRVVTEQLEQVVGLR